MRLVWIGFLFFFIQNVTNSKVWRLQGRAQGTTYHITYYAASSLVGTAIVDSLFERLDSSFSLYRDNSIISRFNKSATGTETDKHFQQVWKSSLHTWKKTGGLFDITVKPLLQAWGFGPGAADTPPDSAEITRLLKCTGTNLLKLNKNFLRKKKPCVQIDMNGIAQGYSVDQACELLDQYGITDYIVELGGEIRVKGRKPDGQPFRIGIESPQEDPMASSLEARLSVPGGAVTTSGSYRQYREYNGKQYAHLMNPLTGYPLQSNLISVTLYAPDALTADAYDNALMLMGLEKAMAFVEKNKKWAAYFIYKDEHGIVKDTATSRFYPMLNP